jgi:UDP-N-acetyl-D-mannosaminuronic acid dehydrogenase
MSSSFDTIAMIGLGYIGLPTAAMFASRKKNVIGVDINQHAVDTINGGHTHIVEPDLDMIVSAAVNQGYLRATTTVQPADAFLIAVPTPFHDNHEPDISYVEAAARSIAPVLKKGDLVILESTSPVGTTEKLAGWLAEERPDLKIPLGPNDAADINLAYCPERVLPGKVIHELVSNDRIIGGITKECSQRAIELYQTFVQGECIETNSRTAEMCKLTENSFRDVNIAFANELSIICGKLGIDVWELIALANRHPRVNVLRPGPGVGGHCIAVDPWFIVHSAPEEAKLIKSAREVNDRKPHWVLENVKQEIERFLAAHPGRQESDVTIACFGLAFKPDIDDLRESPALDIVATITSAHNCRVIVVEPNISALPASLDKGELRTPQDALARSQIAVMLVNHKPFLALKQELFEGKVVIDTCGFASTRK